MTTSREAAPSPLTPAERRERNRREMIDAIIAAARAVMQEHGAAALNLTEVARRVRIRPQSLTEYFPSKSALYDELHGLAMEIFSEGDERAYRDHPAGWDQIEAWFVNRQTLADANPELYHLGFDAPVPEYVPAGQVLQASRELLNGTRQMVAAAIAARAIEPGMTVERTADLLLSMRRGLIAERLGKRRFVEPGKDRFEGMVPEVIRLLRQAWTPPDAGFRKGETP